MGTGWRRAFCTSVPRDDDQTSPHKPPRNFTKLRFLSGGGSNPTTPRLRCRTTIDGSNSTNANPRFDCKMNPNAVKSVGSAPTSPRSPLKLSLFKTSFKFRSNCGICLNSVKTGQGKAIYTAECAHAFHFPCISDYVRENGKLVCPVCYAIWKDVPLLSIHKNLHTESQEETCSVKSPAAIKTYVQPKLEEKRVIEYSPKFAKTPKNGGGQLSPKLCDSRFYDDDEPLMSPITNGKFHPIPEADENLVDYENEEVEEFQGFFVHPVTKPDEIQSREKDSWAVQVRLLPESAVVSTGRGYETYAVALSVKVPSKHTKTTPLLEPSLRAPIDLVTVLDLSDNMTGKRLMMMKRAMALMISSLGSADRLAIVAFSSNTKRLLPLRRMTAQGQRAARRIVDRLVSGEGRNVRDAIRKATKVLEDRRERNPVATMLVFADGEIQGSVSNHASSTKHIEIPVHESGFGHFGGYCQGLSVVVQDLRIQLSFASGSAPAEISAVYSLNGRPSVLNSGSVRLGELYAGEERNLLLELRVPASSSTGSHYVMSVRCLYKDAASQQVVYGRDQALLVPRPHAVRSCAPEIERLRSLFIATRAMAESRRLIEHGDLTSAYHLLGSSRDLLVQCDGVSVDDYVRSLEAEMEEVNGRREMEMEVQRQQMIQRRRVMDKDMMVVMDENGDALTPGSAWRAAERLAKVAMMKKSMNKVSDLHGFENARF